MGFIELGRALAERRRDAIDAWRDASKEPRAISFDEALTAITDWLQGVRSRSIDDIARMPPFGDGKSTRPEGIGPLIAFRNGMESLAEQGSAERRDINEFVMQLGKAISDDLASNVARLIELSSTDALTGAMSRRTVLSILDSEVARSGRHIRPLSIVYLDVDGLKLLNDTKGHAVGDQILRDVVTLIRSNIRSSDSLGRVGGDEFLLVLPDTAADGAEIVASKIVALTKENGCPVTVGTASVTGHEVDSGSLIASADEALRLAKRANREAS